MTREEFKRAGLDKLSPDEMHVLNHYIRSRLGEVNDSMADEIAAISPQLLARTPQCGVDKMSNDDLRECYSKEQARVNAKADSLASAIAIQFRRDAREPIAGAVVSEALRNAASAFTRSQRMWKSYRDQHCEAVMHSWTIGSGAGTAHESCMFNLGRARVQQLRTDFPH